MKFKKILTVNIEHQYFLDANGEMYKFEPRPNCEIQRKRRCDIRLRSQNNGFIMVKDIDREPGPMDKKNAFIHVAVYPEDPLFLAFSHLDIDYHRGSIYYICNDSAICGPAKEEKQLTLIDKSTGNTYEAVQVWLRPKQFSFPVEPAAGDWYKLTDHDGNEIRSWMSQGIENVKQLLIDLGSWPEGLYLLEKNGLVTTRFYITSAESTREQPSPAFIIGIRPQTADKTVPPPADFQVEIAGRKAVWHYHIHAHTNDRKLGELTIKNNNPVLASTVTFDQAQVDKEKKEVIFVSNQPIAMMKKGYREIELFEKPDAGTPMIPHLPNAAATSMHYKDGQWYAQIYVNI